MEWYPLKGDGSGLWGRPFFGNKRLDAELAATPDVRWRAEGGTRCLALPYAADRPFPLVELFCFARVERVCGRECAVYRVDGNGFPVV